MINRDCTRAYILGIDVGTSGLKACILDENARQAARTRAAYRSFALHEGWAEIDPDSLWNAMLKAIRDLRDSGIDLSRVAGIGLSVLCPAFVCMDETGGVLAGPILYSDRRSTKQAEEIAAEMEIPVEKVREISKIAQEPVSLETPIGEEEDSHLGDFIPDEDVPSPADAAAFSMLKEQLDEVLSTLTDREQEVLRLRFGLDDGRQRTLEEVGQMFKVTRERIRQIEAKALRKLRHPNRSKRLRDYRE